MMLQECYINLLIYHAVMAHRSCLCLTMRIAGRPAPEEYLESRGLQREWSLTKRWMQRCHRCRSYVVMHLVLLFDNKVASMLCRTVYPKKYAHGFVVLYFVVVMQSFIMNSHEVFIHIHQGCFAGTGAIVRLPQCQWSKPDGYGKISQCIATTKHSKAKTACIFLGIYCMWWEKYHASLNNNTFVH